MRRRRAAASQPPSLGALEEQVMDVLWDDGPATIRNIIDRLPRPLAYTTIATVLANLGRKGLTSSRKDDRSTLYEAKVGREEHVASLMNHALGTSRDRAGSILHFVDTFPESDLDLLREYLQSRDQTSGSPATNDAGSHLDNFGERGLADWPGADGTSKS